MILSFISIFLISLGCVVMFSAALALIRFPDVYMRLHASAKASTGGTLALLGGVLLKIGLNILSTKIILAIIFILFTGPILSHAIARAAHIKSGMAAEIPFEDLEQSYKNNSDSINIDEENNKNLGDDMNDS